MTTAEPATATDSPAVWCGGSGLLHRSIGVALALHADRARAAVLEGDCLHLYACISIGQARFLGECPPNRSQFQTDAPLHRSLVVVSPPSLSDE